MNFPARFYFDKRTQEILESLTIPFAVYQYIDKRVVTVALSKGFCDEFGFKSLKDAYAVMDNDMYRATHPDDKTRVADAAYRFAAFDIPYDIVYRTRTLKDPDYIILHAYGKSIYPKPDVRLCLTWYANEGHFSNEQGSYESVLNQTLRHFLEEDNQYRGAYYDYMTRLPNTVYFYELAEAGCKKMQEQNIDSAILFFDLTGLKHFNRWHGFEEGNRLICAVADILAKHFSSESCGRFAQDHFAAFAPEKGLKEHLDVIIAECAKANDGKNLPLRIGIYPNRIESVQISMACDRARMAANVRRKNNESYYAFFDLDMMSEEKKRQSIIDNIDKAIEEKWIKVYYQPIVRTTNGKVCSVEALARWDDPVLGMLSPAAFIPVLEDTGLIHKLDMCVVRQVLENLKSNEKLHNHNVPVSINFSRADFEAFDLQDIDRRARGVEAGQLASQSGTDRLGAQPASKLVCFHRRHRNGNLRIDPTDTIPEFLHGIELDIGVVGDQFVRASVVEIAIHSELPGNDIVEVCDGERSRSDPFGEKSQFEDTGRSSHERGRRQCPHVFLVPHDCDRLVRVKIDNVFLHRGLL